MSKIGERSFDVRVVERALHRGEMKPVEYEKFLKSLPDEADLAVETRPGDPEIELLPSSPLPSPKEP